MIKNYDTQKKQVLIIINLHNHHFYSSPPIHTLTTSN